MVAPFGPARRAAMRVVRVAGVPDAAIVAQAADCVAAGGTLIFPTETVYGIGCDPNSEPAVAAIFRAKRRPIEKPLAVHVAQPQDALPFARTLTSSARGIMHACWPGPVAIIVERVSDVAQAAALGGLTISLRCPDDDACRAILAATGPLAATSANISGADAFTGDEDAIDTLPDAALAIITGPTRLRQESTVVDCTQEIPRIVRQGAVDAKTIQAACERTPQQDA